MTEDLIKKLMVSKKIMDKHKQMPRGQVSESFAGSPSSPQVENFAPISASYNIPEEYSTQQPKINSVKKENSKEKIMGSKLPDNIKRLMLEHPISSPQQNGPVLSDDIIEKASRLMNNERGYEQSTPKTQKQSLPNTDFNEDIRSIVRETMEDILKENGLLIESVQKSNDVFSFRVGNHIFEGKVTKIKKVK